MDHLPPRNPKRGSVRGPQLAHLPLAALLVAAGAAADGALVATGFEHERSTSDLERTWSNVWTTDPGNQIDVSVERVHSGARALRFRTVPADPGPSKALIEKRGLALRAGDGVHLRAWLFLPSGPDLGNVFLFDLECSDCARSAPGVRVMLRPGGYPAFERGKLRLPTLDQPRDQRVALPRDRWFRLEWSCVLGSDEGFMQLEVDGVSVLAARGVNLPPGGRYDRLQAGITASAAAVPVELWLDDFELARAGSAE